MALLLVVLLGADSVAVSTAWAVPATSYSNPVVRGLTANPFVLKAPDGTYYAYVNGFDFYLPFPVMALSSTDLATWTQVGNVLSDGGAWADTSSGWNVTSPSVRFIPSNPVDARYVMYFSSRRRGSTETCIGVAVAAGPSGPFAGAADPLICPAGGARDPSILPLPDGIGLQELVYTVNGANPGVYRQVLTADGRTQAPGWTPKLLLSARSGWWQDGVIERPTITSDGTTTHLFFAAGKANTGSRAIGWATCTAPLAVLDTCASRTGHDRFVATSDAVASPSGPQVFSDGTRQWLVYDGLPGGSCASATCTGTREMRIDKLCFLGGQPRTTAPSIGTQTLARESSCTADVPDGWQASWGGHTSNPGSTWPTMEPRFANGFAAETLRQVVHTSIGGSQVRVKLSNRAGTTPLPIANASVGVSSEPAGSTAAVSAPVRPLTFGGRPGITVAPGQTVVSDAVTLAVPADHDLAVSLYFPTATGTANGHVWSGETSFIGPGNLVNDATGGGFTATTLASFFVTAVDVYASAPKGTVAVLGDSLSDGIFFAGTDAERRWPDRLVDRLLESPLAAPPLRVGVVNMAIAGNTLLPATGDPNSGLGRLDDEILSQAGIRTVFVHLGTNDIGRSSNVDSIVDGLRQLVARAHAVGVRVVATTIPPMGGPVATSGQPSCAGAAAPDATAEATRQGVNARIRPGSAQSLALDAVVDFDIVLRDPANPSRIQCRYAGFGENFHPNELGHRAEGDAIDLAAVIA